MPLPPSSDPSFPPPGPGAADPGPDPRRTLGIERALLCSPFLARCCARLGTGESGAWLQRIAGHAWTQERIGEALDAEIRAETGAGGAQAKDPAAPPTPEVLETALRRVRRDLVCGQLVREAGGLASLEETMLAMTALGDVALGRLVPACHAELAAARGAPMGEDGRPQHLLVVAMGKAGAGELNVSSDIDLIFAYAEDGRSAGRDGTGAAAIDNAEFFARLGRRVIAALSQETGEGFVFRVDMRLRPHGDAGPLVVSLAMLEEYLVREGREWERFAWSRARVLATGDGPDFAVQRGALERLVLPFVWRKYLDFGAIGAVRDLHRRIGEARDRRAARRGDARIDVKVGRGGIREVEFLVQSFSVMRGGREPELRERTVPGLLARLSARALLGAHEASALESAWRLLRRIEHALQWREDAQTHALDAGGPGTVAVAALLGFAGEAELLAALAAANDTVAGAFDSLLRAPGAAVAGTGGGDEDDALPGEAELRQLGFADPGACHARLAALVGSPRWREASANIRATVARLSQRAAMAVAARMGPDRPAGLPGPDALLLRWVGFLESVGRRSTYLSLLAEYPRALEQVLMVLDAGGWAADYLHRHPVVLDEMLEHSGATEDPGPPGDPLRRARMARAFDERLVAAGAGDVERQMNVLRDLHHGQVFRLLLADLRGELALEALADRLSELADATIETALRGAWRALHEGADPPAPPLAVVAYGKLGGLELGYASDLDLIFVTGGESCAPASLYTRWVRQLITWLTAATSSGTLFEIDLRLRPNGNAGLLVTPLDAFERYQRNEDGHGAWVWEHQALTRARACAGDAALGERVEALRREVLARPRDIDALAAEVRAMRQRMLEGHPNRSVLFDLKHDRGGMVDVEFVNQFLVLAHAHAQPLLLANKGNLALLHIAAGQGLVDPALAEGAAQAYRQYRQTQHLLRRNGAERALVDPATVQTHVAAVLALWQAVLGVDGPAPSAAA